MINYYPIFINLKDKLVLVVGAGEVAERKILGLMEAGAEVHIIAQTLTDNIKEWVHERRIFFEGETIIEEWFEKVYLIIAASNDQKLNENVANYARKYQKLINVVDQEPLCTFILPSIVHRGPVKIAVSTSGLSPVLGRIIKEKIELLIPNHIGSLAILAGKWRAVVKDKIAKIIERRYFWEKLLCGPFDLAVRNNQIKKAEKILVNELESFESEQGEVILVGAGPGDSGLLTIKAFQAIQRADVVLYDALVSEEILTLVRKDAEKIYVGKRSGNHHVVQEKTNELLVQLAKEGKKVVRLKGGDPFVFGRGGEELSVLVNNKIPFQVVPGITAALGASAYSGIPLTHRDYSQTMIFITGQLASVQSTLNWPLLAQKHQTLVIYMGTVNAKEIRDALIQYGRDYGTPVAIISRGTLGEQNTIIGTLEELGDLAKNAPSPSLMIIGEVVDFHHKLSWFIGD